VNDLSTPGSDDLDASRAPLMDHLVELRKRLIWSFATLLLTFFLAFAFVDPIFTVLVQPLLEAGHDRMIFTGVMEAFFTRVKVAFFAAIMISFPVLATQLWLFIAPGLYKQEQRASAVPPDDAGAVHGGRVPGLISSRCRWRSTSCWVFEGNLAA
jgi:Sec-independent protein secretion pathway component TatC